MSIFKACDIRGPYGADLNDSHAAALGHALALLQGPGEVLIAGDGRQSTPRLKKSLIDALVASGCKVTDLNTVPTPAFYFARQRLGIQTGVMVTASHNPAHHNGFKITLGEYPISQEEIHRIRALMEQESRAPTLPGALTSYTILPEYIEFLQAQGWDLAGLSVAVDYGSGMAALTGPSLWAASGAQVYPLHDSPDGRFPHRSPNPSVAKNLSALRQAVLAQGADLGVAYDGDGDRVAFLDEHGSMVPNDIIIAAFAGALLAGRPAAVVYDQKCSRLVPEQIQQAGGRPILERSGHTYIKTTFLRQQAVYAGELSGHHFFQNLPQGDDGLYASLRFADLLAQAGEPLSQLAAAFPQYAITPDIRLPVEPYEAEKILAQLQQGLSAEARISELDGVRAEFPDGWGLARKSVTEPMITLRFEGTDPQALGRIMSRFKAVAPQLGGRLPSG